MTVTPFQRDYAQGQAVTLTATPSPPSVFVGWYGISTGDLIATTNPVTVTMTAADRTVRARFASPVPLAEGMVAFWRGETDATDLIGGHSGTFYTGTTPTTPSVTATGKVGGAFNFDGTVYVQVPDSAALRPAQMTAEAWVSPAPSIFFIDFNAVIARRSSTGITWSLGLTLGTPQFYSQNGAGSLAAAGSDALTAPSAIPMNQWTHLAITFDGTTKRAVRQRSAGGLAGRPGRTCLRSGTAARDYRRGFGV